MIDVKKLKDELSKLAQDSIVLVETSAEKSFEASMTCLKILEEKYDNGIILSVNRPYVNLVSNYKKNGIDTKKMFIIDCISKKHYKEMDVENVMFLESASALTDISVALGECMQRTEGKKFVLVDSTNIMLIHNKPHIFARFIHGVLTKMRLNKVGGILISLDDKTNEEVRAEIAQLCDKSIKV